MICCNAVWLQSPLPYFAQFPEADILASTDVMLPTHDDGGLEDPQVMGWEDLNIGQSPSLAFCKQLSNLPTLHCKPEGQFHSLSSPLDQVTQAQHWLAFISCYDVVVYMIVSKAGGA